MQHAGAWGWSKREQEVREAKRQGETMADAELEACCKWLTACNRGHLASNLRLVRRPAPAILREQALAALQERLSDPNYVMLDANVEAMELAIRALQEGADG